MPQVLRDAARGESPIAVYFVLCGSQVFFKGSYGAFQGIAYASLFGSTVVEGVAAAGEGRATWGGKGGVPSALSAPRGI